MAMGARMAVREMTPLVPILIVLACALGQLCGFRRVLFHFAVLAFFVGAAWIAAALYEGRL